MEPNNKNSGKCFNNINSDTPKFKDNNLKSVELDYLTSNLHKREQDLEILNKQLETLRQNIEKNIKLKDEEQIKKKNLEKNVRELTDNIKQRREKFTNLYNSKLELYNNLLSEISKLECSKNNETLEFFNLIAAPDFLYEDAHKKFINIKSFDEKILISYNKCTDIRNELLNSRKELHNVENDQSYKDVDIVKVDKDQNKELNNTCDFLAKVSDLRFQQNHTSNDIDELYKISDIKTQCDVCKTTIESKYRNSAAKKGAMDRCNDSHDVYKKNQKDQNGGYDWETLQNNYLAQYGGYSICPRY